MQPRMPWLAWLAASLTWVRSCAKWTEGKRLGAIIVKIVISRKGFDSSYGEVPSPVLPGIGPVSLPIPSQEAKRQGRTAQRDFLWESCFRICR